MSWQKYLNTERLRKSNRNTENDPRNEFESDYGRVIFSPAVRRMHDKTQVMPLTTDDNIHSRLTHSLEVMAIGYSLGIKLIENKEFSDRTNLGNKIREIPVILKSVALVHDIGNPPFGHFGEESIKAFFKDFFIENKDIELTKQEKDDFLYFDGNAQGFRILTKLQLLNDLYGLNLTKASLATYLKYPNCGEPDNKYLRTKKRGVFSSEKDYLLKIAEGCGLKVNGNIIRHPLAFLVEAADTICYRAMDIEDGYNKGWYSFNDIKMFFIDSSLKDSIEKILEKKQSDTYNVVNFRISLISRLVSLTADNFMKNYDNICCGDFNKELLHDDSDKLEKKLESFCNKNIFTQREIQSLELTGDSVIKGLLSLYTSFIFNKNEGYRKNGVGLISRSIINVAKMEEKLSIEDSFDSLSDYSKLRVIVDFISGMTDQYALSHYQRLNGQKII